MRTNKWFCLNRRWRSLLIFEKISVLPKVFEQIGPTDCFPFLWKNTLRLKLRHIVALSQLETERNYRITRGLVLTRPSVDRKKAHLCMTNTFVSILFLREESSRQRYLDSYLQDNSGDIQYSASNPVRTEFHFSALHHGDYDVLWGAELWFVVCGCVLVRK